MAVKTLLVNLPRPPFTTMDTRPLADDEFNTWVTLPNGQREQQLRRRRYFPVIVRPPHPKKQKMDDEWIWDQIRNHEAECRRIERDFRRFLHEKHFYREAGQ